MKKKILNLIFCFLSVLLFGQKRLHSPIKFSEYKNLKNEYINAVDKNKDSLILVDNYYFVKSKLDSIPNAENNSASIFTVSRNNFNFYYRPSHDELQISFHNNDTKIVYWFQGDTNSEFINDNKIRTWNRYFSKNGQLKHSYTNKLSNNEQIGIAEEYNIIGKRLFYADWDKDFKSTEKQVKKLSEKHLSKCIRDYNNKKLNAYWNEDEMAGVIKGFLQKIPKIYKYIDEDREPNWWVIYDGEPKIEIKFSDKTDKFKNCEVGYSIE
jgi:hypothetical protein